MLRLTPKLIEYSAVTNYSSWEKMIITYTEEKSKQITIGMPGKYMEIRDSYVSIIEAFNHCGAKTGTKIDLKFIDTEKADFQDVVKSCDGILLTPGFGSRGVEGMIQSATLAIENDIPFLGICFGAQLLYVAFMRKIMGYDDANSTEINPQTTHPVVDMLDEQVKVTVKGGTMRLGAHKINLVEGTKLRTAYQKEQIKERFRHRYHIMENYIDDKAKSNGMLVAAWDTTGKIVNAIEIDGKHWMVGTQFHPEYKSRPWAPSPIYLSFVEAVIKKKGL
jgi:CTP synthase